MEKTRLYMYSSFPFLDSRKKDRSKFSSKGRLAVSRHHVDDICLRSLPLPSCPFLSTIDDLRRRRPGEKSLRKIEEGGDFCLYVLAIKRTTKKLLLLLNY